VLCVLKHITGPETSADSAISGLQDASVVKCRGFSRLLIAEVFLGN